MEPTFAGPTLLRPVLVLDAGYQAVNVVPLRRALRLIAAGKATTVEEDQGLVLRSERLRLHCPVIIRLCIAVAHRVYRALRVRFNKRNVLARDEHCCQYCGQSENLTIDHVVPRSRRTRDFPEGGASSWENCVAACLPCNLRKGDRTPEEAGMTLQKSPSVPRTFMPLVGHGFEPETAGRWRKYLAS